MNTEQSKHWMLETWKTFASRDAARIGAVFTEDAEWHAPAGNATAIALAGPSHMAGREAIARFLAHELHRLFDDIAIEFRGLYAEGRTVIVEETMRARLKPDGRPYENDYCFIFEFDAAGRVHRVREYMDTLRGQRLILGS